VVVVVAAVMLLGACSSTDQRAGTVPPGDGEATTTVAPADTTMPATDATTLRPAVEPAGEVVTGTLVTPDGRTRGYRLYVPSTPTDAPAPLLIGLHGGTGWAEQFENNSGYDGLAEANGVLVVYPEGVGSGGAASPTFGPATRTWNGGVCCGPAARDDVDDVAFIEALIDEVAGRYRVDPDRVFATGHSNGAIMSYRLACELSDKVVAAAFFAGTLGVDDCRPSTPVSLMHLHGTADEHLPYTGGVGPKSIAGVDFPSPTAGVRTFATADGCPADPVTATSVTDPNVRTESWSPCGDGTEVRFVTIEGASHAWPGSTPRTAISGEPYAGYDASAELLAFLLAHPRSG
jgi:polyhydroxybutyrate depolymerase